MFVRSKPLLLFWLICCSSSLCAQYVDPHNAASFALSGIDSRLPNGALLINPAGMFTGHERGIGMNCLNVYGLSELSTSTVSFQYKLKRNEMESAMRFFGSSLFHETQLSIRTARLLYPWLKAGVRMNYFSRNSILMEQAEHFLSADIGLQFLLSSSISLSACLLNPIQTLAKSFSRREESILMFGIHHSEPGKYVASVQLFSMSSRSLGLSAGFEYYLLSQLIIRTGVRLGEQFSYSFGMGLIRPRMIFDIGFEEHLVLGLSASVMIFYKLKKG